MRRWSVSKGSGAVNSRHRRHARGGEARPGGLQSGQEGQWIWGIHAAREMIDEAPEAVRVLHVTRGNRRPEAAALVADAGRAQIEVKVLETKIAGLGTDKGAYQGVAVEMRSFQYSDLESIVRRDPEIIVALDCIQDPRNLGAILRTCAALSVDAVILPRNRSVGITPAVVRGSSGLAFRTAVVRVVNMVRTIEQLKSRGWWAVGLVPGAGITMFDLAVPRRVLLVAGGEEGGIRRLVARCCDSLVGLPMAAGVDSLNVAVATGVALYEIERQRRRA